MNPTNRIALFEMTSRYSPSGWAIAIATFSTIVHAAVQDGKSGKWYDASETRGDCAEMDTGVHENRMCYLIEFEGDLTFRLQRMLGKGYDFRGVALWLLCRWSAPLQRRGIRVLRGKWACGDNGKPFCFEFGWFAMTGEVHKGAVSGRDLRRWALKHGLTVRYGRFGDIAK